MLKTMEHHLYVVMGISSCGKSSVGQELAKVLGNSLVDGSVEYYEGDAYHPKNNVEKMRNGTTCLFVCTPRQSSYLF